MSKIDKSKPILITGGTGYIAAWIIKFLLEDGSHVRATVRDKNNKKKVEHLLEIEKNSSGKLEFFEADLLKEGIFDDAVKDCELVIHTASPFVVNNIKDAQKELVDPALEGTKNVLNSVNKSENVKRVVLTSSVVSIHGDAKDIEKTKNNIFTEEDWNTTSSLTHQPYSLSKTLAEKEAWEICKKQRKWDLVTINPGFVFGPSLSNRVDSTSVDFMLNMINGTRKTGVPELYFGIVDVRDVAKAHINAGFIDEAKGRNILVADTIKMLEIANLLRDNYGKKYSLPKSTLPKALVYLFGPFNGYSWKNTTLNVGIPIKFDNSKSINELKIDYKELKVTLNEHIAQIIEKGLI